MLPCAKMTDFSTKCRVFYSLICLGLITAAHAQLGDTNIQRETEWRYYDLDPTLVPTNWASPTFDDSGWSAGDAMLGYESPVDPSLPDFSTIIGFGPDINNKYFSAYFRRAFVVTNASEILAAEIGLRRDDGAVVYLNGIEVARNNMPEGTITPTTQATVKSGGGLNDFYFQHFFNPALLLQGTNLMAVRIHQYNATSSDLRFDLELTTSTTISNSVIRGPYLQSGTPTQTMLRWRTRLPTDSHVRYGQAPGALSQSVIIADPTREHVATLTNLVPATRYYYAIGESNGDFVGDDADHYFQTSPIPGSPKKSRIWIIGDSGTSEAFAHGNSSDGSVGYIKSAALYQAYLAMSTGVHTDIWLALGDNAYNSGTDAEYQAGFFDKYPELLRRTACWTTPGNHEFYNNVTFSDLEVGPYYDIFSPPTQGEAGGLQSGKEAYYSFDFANIHFISLDSFGTDRTTNGAMYAWLELDLAATLQEWIIAFWHHPPYTKGTHNSDNALDSEGRMRDMRERFLPLMDAYGVDMVLSGHSHAYERSHPVQGHYGLSPSLTTNMIADAGDGIETGDGAYRQSTGTGVVYVVAGSSGKIGAHVDLNHPVMAESLWDHGSVVLDVSDRRLDSTFLNDEGQAQDTYTILHDVPRDEDTDDDTLPDWWEQWHFGNLSQTTNGHADADGVNNLDEYQAGTDPNDADSFLMISELSTSVTSNGVTIQWPAVPGQAYTIQAASNLQASATDWHVVSPTTLQVNVFGDLTFETIATNAAAQFYYRLMSSPLRAW